jgi:hypothetical protein
MPTTRTFVVRIHSKKHCLGVRKPCGETSDFLQKRGCRLRLVLRKSGRAGAHKDVGDERPSRKAYGCL